MRKTGFEEAMELPAYAFIGAVLFYLFVAGLILFGLYRLGRKIYQKL